MVLQVYPIEVFTYHILAQNERPGSPPVHDLPVMDVLDTQAELHKPIQDDFLGQMPLLVLQGGAQVTYIVIACTFKQSGSICLLSLARTSRPR